MEILGILLFVLVAIFVLSFSILFSTTLLTALWQKKWLAIPIAFLFYMLPVFLASVFSLLLLSITMLFITKKARTI